MIQLQVAMTFCSILPVCLPALQYLLPGQEPEVRRGCSMLFCHFSWQKNMHARMPLAVGMEAFQQGCTGPCLILRWLDRTTSFTSELSSSFSFRSISNRSTRTRSRRTSLRRAGASWWPPAVC